MAETSGKSLHAVDRIGASTVTSQYRNADQPPVINAFKTANNARKRIKYYTRWRMMRKQQGGSWSIDPVVLGRKKLVLILTVVFQNLKGST